MALDGTTPRSPLPGTVTATASDGRSGATYRVRTADDGTVAGFEVHGSEGSLIAKDVMTQKPIGSVILRTAKGEAELTFDRDDLYTRSLGLFHKAIRDEGAPSATGEDGVWSLAAAEAALQSAKSGRAVRVEAGL